MALVIKKNQFEDGVLKLSLSGEIDLVSAPILKESLENYFEDQHADFHLDFENITFIDSTGLGTLVSFNKSIKPEYRIKLFHAQSHVAKVFKITGLYDLFFS